MTAFHSVQASHPRYLDSEWVSAGDYGVRVDSLDNTDALMACAVANETLSGRRIVRLPQGVIRGRLPMVPGVLWFFEGTTLKFPLTGPTGHIVYPRQWSWWGDLEGYGAHRSGLIGYGLIDGGGKSWGIDPLPMAPQPTITATTGTIPAGTHAWRIAFARPGYGQGVPGSQRTLTLASAGGANLSWTTPAGAEGAEVYIFGRSSVTMWEQRVIARLPAGTTSFTDNGSITPFAEPCRLLDISAPSVVMTGAAWDVDNITIDNMPGTGFVSRFDADIPKNEPRQQMEGVARNLRISRSGANAVGFCGPHDTVFRDLFISDSGRVDYADTRPTQTHFMLADNGPCIVQNSHMWGYSKWCVDARYRVEVHNCQLEGGSAGQINIQYDSRISDTELFFPQGGSSVGIRVGESWWKPSVHIEGVRLRGFSSSSGVALDLRNAAENSRIRCMVNQDTGSVRNGGDQCDAEITVVGLAQAQTVKPVHIRVTDSGPPTLGTWLAGQLATSKDGAIHTCTVAGSPGTWRTL